MIRCIVGIYLGLCSITDIKRKEISLRLTGGFGALGILLQMLMQKLPWSGWAGGIIAGVCLLGISGLTCGAIGYGDCLAMMVVGAYLGLGGAAGLFLTALTLAAVYSAVLLAVGRADKKTKLPFLPFLFAAHAGISFIEWSGRI